MGLSQSKKNLFQVRFFFGYFCLRSLVDLFVWIGINTVCFPPRSQALDFNKDGQLDAEEVRIWIYTDPFFQTHPGAAAAAAGAGAGAKPEVRRKATHE